jgi:MFS family permease
MTRMAEAGPAGTTGLAEGYDDRRARRTVALVLVASFVVFADVAILTLAAPTIRRELGASVTEVELMVAAYQICYASTLITGGRLGDILGRRTMFTVGFCAFILASAACGLATTPRELIAFRAVQGVAAALLSPQVLSTVHMVLPPEKRVGAYAAQGAVLASAAMSGSTIGGLLIAANIFDLGWRAIFLINVPIGIVSVILGLRLVPAMRSPSAKRLDLRGVLLLVTTLVCVMAPVTVGARRGWPLWAWLCLAVVPGLVFVFLRSQRWLERRGGSPLLPTDLWRDRGFRLGIGLVFLVFSGMSAFFLFYFILLQVGYGIAPLWAALSIMPGGVMTLTTASLLSWRLVRRWGGQRVVTIGAATCAVGFLSMMIPVTQVTDHTVALWTIPSQLVYGAGFGLVHAPLFSVVLGTIRSAEAGAAVGLLTTAQMVGSACGVGLTGLLFQVSMPRLAELASAGDLVGAMTRCLVYNPIAFTLAVTILLLLPKLTARGGPVTPERGGGAIARA